MSNWLCGRVYAGDTLEVMAPTGVPTAAQLASLARAFAQAEIFICGPAPFMDAAEAARAVALTVLLDGETHRIEANSGEFLLTAMDRAGLRVPHSCRIGGCASCMCKVNEGAVKLQANTALDETDLAAGWTLACQAVAETDAVTVAFPD